jgi:hypothetical protein
MKSKLDASAGRPKRPWLLRSPPRPHCLAGLVGLELRNPCESYVFEEVVITPVGSAETSQQRLFAFELRCCGYAARAAPGRLRKACGRETSAGPVLVTPFHQTPPPGAQQRICSLPSWKYHHATGAPLRLGSLMTTSAPASRLCRSRNLRRRPMRSDHSTLAS